MGMDYDVIWGFKEDILEVKDRFKERVWSAHLSQNLGGRPLHKYKGKLVLEKDGIHLSGKDKDTQEPLEIVVSRQDITDVNLGWDETLGRLKDTRAWIKPLRITFKVDGQERILYLYVKGKKFYGEENKRLYEELT